MPPRAIETRYKGYRFRSRLEARWAVFFDHLGLKWEYEPEGFELGGGVRYLPDFSLCGKYYAEVKPGAADGPQFDKAKKLASLGHTVIALGGPPDTIAYPVFGVDDTPGTWSDVAFNANSKYGPFFWCCGVACWDDWVECAGWLMDSDGGTLRRAINAARSARFEFGESGVRR